MIYYLNPIHYFKTPGLEFYLWPFPIHTVIQQNHCETFLTDVFIIMVINLFSYFNEPVGLQQCPSFSFKKNNSLKILQ